MLWVLIRITSILMSTHNIGFYEDLTKIIFELSSNTQLISSAEHYAPKHMPAPKDTGSELEDLFVC